MILNYDKYFLEKGPTLGEYLESIGINMTLVDNIWYDASGKFSTEELNKIMEEYNPWPVEIQKKWEEAQLCFKEATDQLIRGTVDTERSSWSLQESEARKWLEDNSVPTPALTILANARKIPLPLLVAKVIEKAELYKTYYFTFQGMRDKMEDQIKQFSVTDPLDRLPELRNIKYGE